MALTENAKIVYIGTDLGNRARECATPEEFLGSWTFQILTNKDSRIVEALKSMHAFEFWEDANRGE